MTPNSRLPRPSDTPVKVSDLIKRWQKPSDSIDEHSEADSEVALQLGRDTFRGQESEASRVRL